MFAFNRTIVDMAVLTKTRVQVQNSTNNLFLQISMAHQGSYSVQSNIQLQFKLNKLTFLKILGPHLYYAFFQLSKFCSLWLVHWTVITIVSIFAESSVMPPTLDAVTMETECEEGGEMTKMGYIYIRSQLFGVTVYQTH